MNYGALLKWLEAREEQAARQEREATMRREAAQRRADAARKIAAGDAATPIDIILEALYNPLARRAA